MPPCRPPYPEGHGHMDTCPFLGQLLDTDGSDLSLYEKMKSSRNWSKIALSALGCVKVVFIFSYSLSNLSIESFCRTRTSKCPNVQMSFHECAKACPRPPHTEGRLGHLSLLTK